MKKHSNALELLFPSQLYCICCGSIIDRTRPYGFCDRCVEKIHWVNTNTCGKCGKISVKGNQGGLCRDCRHEGHVFDKGYTCCAYGLYARVVMMALKYGNKPYIGRLLGDILTDRMAGEAYRPDLVIPVPVSRNRMAQRGYNQSELMARQFAKRLQVPMEPRLLLRTRETKAMKQLDKEDRKTNLEGAFSLAKGRGNRVCNASVLLIDDIYTTGSTADSCAAVLKEAGAREVRVLTFSAGVGAATQNSLQ